MGACSGAQVQPTLTVTPAAQADAPAAPAIVPTASAVVPSAQSSPTPTVDVTIPQCPLPPVVVPTSAPDPGYTELDPTTGLHMTGRPKQLDLATYHLEVTGKVDHPLSLSYDDLRCLPKKQVKATLICPGYFEDVATWSGAQLSTVLAMAGVQADAKSITMKGADGYSGFALLKDIQSPDNLIAYEWKDEPLPILHGFPVRMVFPGLSGGHWVKWLTEIVVE